MAKKFTDQQEKVLIFLHGHPNSNEDKIAAATSLDIDEVRKAIIELRELGLVGGDPLLLDSVSECLVAMDKSLTPTSESFPTAAILVASHLEGADEREIASGLGFEPEFVNLVGARLRASGIWQGNKLNPKSLANWENDALSFYLDLNVASGDMAIVGEVDGAQTKYQMTEGGKRRVESLRKRP